MLRSAGRVYMVPLLLHVRPEGDKYLVPRKGPGARVPTAACGSIDGMVNVGRQALGHVRRACLALPEVTERPSHGAPAFFVRDRSAFVNAWIAGHHDHHFPHLWCAAGPGVQEALVQEGPSTYFRPPYVGHRGWVGVRLDCGIGWEEVEDLCEDAYRAVAPRRLVDELDAGCGERCTE